jgi:ribA/ribD-fused uncharacterized protein
MILDRANTVFFWGGPFSQWMRAPIVIDGVSYNCNEQYMMAQKALHFGDESALSCIMNTKDPREQKAFGRTVIGFDQNKWNEIARLVVYRANFAKFTQNADMIIALRDTGTMLIVEASHEDKIWGIGLGEADPDVLDTDKWQGTNWLGEAIMQVRSDLVSLATVGAKALATL